MGGGGAFSEDLTDGGGVAFKVMAAREVLVKEGCCEGMHGRVCEHGAPAVDQGVGGFSLANSGLHRCPPILDINPGGAGHPLKTASIELRCAHFFQHHFLYRIRAHECTPVEYEGTSFISVA